MNHQRNRAGSKLIPAATSFAMALLFGGFANADMPIYRYIEAGYSTGDLDISISGLGSVDIDQDGFEIEGSASLFDDRVWLLGSYSDLSGDEAGIDLDIETIGLGAGWIFNPGQATAIDASIIYRQDELSALGASEDVDGFGIAAGIRSNVTEIVEIFGRLGYLEGDYEGAIVADLGIVFNIGERFGVTGSYEWLDTDEQGVEVELTQFQIAGRVKF